MTKRKRVEIAFVRARRGAGPFGVDKPSQFRMLLRRIRHAWQHGYITDWRWILTPWPIKLR